MNTSEAIDFSSLCSWIPGSRAKPAPRNDGDKAFFRGLLEDPTIDSVDRLASQPAARSPLAYSPQPPAFTGRANSGTMTLNKSERSRE